MAEQDNSISADKIFDNALRMAADVVNRELRRRDGSQGIVDEILGLQRLGCPEDQECSCDGITKCRNCECADLYKDATAVEKAIKGCGKLWDYGDDLNKCGINNLCAECGDNLVKLFETD